MKNRSPKSLEGQRHLVLLLKPCNVNVVTIWDEGYWKLGEGNENTYKKNFIRFISINGNDL